MSKHDDFERIYHETCAFEDTHRVEVPAMHFVGNCGYTPYNTTKQQYINATMQQYNNTARQQYYNTEMQYNNGHVAVQYTVTQ